jgi:hypothetical protein
VTAAVFSQAESFVTETCFIVYGMGIPEERFPPPVLDDLQALTTAPKKMHPPLRHAGPHAAAHKRAEKALPDFAGVPMSRELASAPVPRIWTTPSDL